MAILHMIYVAVAVFIGVSFAAPSPDKSRALPIPPECVGQGFCSVKPPGYDLLEEKINSILPDILVKEYAERSGSDLSLSPPKLSPKEDWHNCPYETKTEIWYAYYHGANNTEPEYIVQTNLFAQQIQSVTCAYSFIDSTSDVQCFEDLGVANFNLQSKCHTSYATRTLYVFDLKRNLIIQKPFPVPSCCQCHVKYKD